jgi:hypothetical protein
VKKDIRLVGQKADREETQHCTKQVETTGFCLFVNSGSYYRKVELVAKLRQRRKTGNSIEVIAITIY